MNAVPLSSSKAAAWGRDVRIRTSEVGSQLGSITVGTALAELWFAWVGDHARDVDRYSREYLSPDESERITQYRGRAAAERYVVTRALVRLVLGAHLGLAARDIRVSRTDTGKPIVAEGLHFNVSHSGDLVLLAVSAERAVGVDVERKREVQRVPALVRRWLTESEQREFDQWCAVGATESEAFLRVWSIKEARLKALGVGIAGAATAQTDRVDARPLDALLDTLTGAHVGQGYVGAVAFA